MNVLPVIEREMRAQSRLTFTYWLRVLSASALLFVALFFGPITASPRGWDRCCSAI